MSWLLDRLPPELKKKNNFVFLGAVHWPRGLALICNKSKPLLAQFYDRVQPKDVNEEADNQVFLQIMMSLHYLATLKSMNKRLEDAQVFSRIAIVSWYYGILNAAKAMNTATDNSDSQTHRKAADEWDAKISSRKLILSPFDYRINSLVKKSYMAEINKYPNCKGYSQRNPSDLTTAEGICCSYLSGTADWYRKKEEIKIRSSKEYTGAGFQNFKSKDSQGLRDSSLSKKSCGFLHEAFRYRGKSNYRDVTYLAHTTDFHNQFMQLLSDLDSTLEFFITMAISYCSRRLKKETFKLFIEDASKNALLKDMENVLIVK
ncbi:MAG TPA: hypothetical protein VNC84_00520 [Gammaproteobacteria bacterium]|jgi:hypothetical protein|nr:hypothetical protein [Gammaproteobacteria bacterium]